jgi:potassium-dependent mechanosensitive channel
VDALKVYLPFYFFTPRELHTKNCMSSLRKTSAALHRAICIGLFLIFCWVLRGDIARAQQTSPGTPKPSPANAVPTPIPLSQIAAEAQTTDQTVRDIETHLSTDQLTASIEEHLPQLASEVELRTNEMTKLMSSRLPLELLRHMENAIRTLHDELSTWNRELTEHAKTLDDQFARLDTLSKTWKATLQLPELSKAAPEIPKRVQAMISSIARTQQGVESLRERDLTLQGRVLEATTELQIASSAIGQAQTDAIKNLFIQDSPPIWSLGAKNWKEETRAPTVWRASANVALTYILRQPLVFLFHALVILVLIVAMYWLRRRVHRWTEEEPNLRRAAPVFDVPVSTAIALSFLMASSIYSLAPFLIRAVLGAAILIPTALILRRLIDRTLFPIVNALLIFYFVDQLRTVMAVLPLSGRFAFAAEMLGAILFLTWLIRGKRSPAGDGKSKDPFARTIRRSAQAGLILFSVAFLADVFGYVNFAYLIGSGALRSAYVGAALYAALRIVEGLIIISLATRPLALMRVVRLNRPMLQRRICRTAEFLAFLYWLSLTLDFFALRTPMIANIAAALQATLTIGSLSVSLGHLLVFVVTAWASFALSRFLRFILEEDVYHHWELARGIPQAISTMVHYTVLLVGFFIALAALGVDLTKVTILAGAFTVGVGFGLQTVINNFVCGLILLFERPIKVGDIIQIDADIGEVRRIGIRACIIRTADGSEVIVPNGTIIANKVTNWTFSDRYRAVEISVTVARGAPPQRVIDVLKQVAASHASVAKEPAPQAYVVSFGPASANFQLRAWTDRYQDWIQVRSDLSVATDEALMRENMTLA